MSEPNRPNDPSLDEALKNAVPSKSVNVDMPENAPQSSEESIDAANEHTTEMLQKNVIEKIMDAYTKAETERSHRQTPLFKCISWLTIGQLIAFNLIIAITGFFSFRSKETEVIVLYFEICKYYVGATIVELIGMLAFIMKGTFSSEHIDMMKLVLEGLPSHKKKNK